MKWTYRVIRAVIVTALLLAVVVPALLYVGLSLPGVQRHIRDRAADELTALLGCRVDIGSLGIMPFNRVVMRDVALTNAPGDTIARIGRLGAGVDLYSLLVHGDIVVNYTEVVGLDARVSRAHPGSPLNIQPIIDALQPKDRTKPPTRFRLAVNTVVIRRTSLAYDVLSRPETPGQFNPSHIKIVDLRGDIRFPVIADNGVEVDIKRLSCSERSGLTLGDMQCMAIVMPGHLSLSGFRLEMPSSSIALGDIDIRYEAGEGLRGALAGGMAELVIKPGSHVSTTDIEPLLPQLRGMDAVVEIAAEMRGNLAQVDIDRLEISSQSPRLHAGLSSRVSDMTDRSRMSVSLHDMTVRANAPELLGVIGATGTLRRPLPAGLGSMGDFELTGSGEASSGDGYLSMALVSGAGNLDIDCSYASRNGIVSYEGRAVTTGLDIGALTARSNIGVAAADIAVSGREGRGLRDVDGDCVVDMFEFNGHTYSNVEAAVSLRGKRLQGMLRMPDSLADVDLTLLADLTRGANEFELHGAVRGFDPHALGLTAGLAGMTFGTDIDVSLAGESPGCLDGTAILGDINLTNGAGQNLRVNSVTVDTRNSSSPCVTALKADMLSATLQGRYDFRNLGADIRNIVARVFPALTGRTDIVTPMMPVAGHNDFDFDLTVTDTEPYVDFFKLPVSVIYPVTLHGRVDSSSGSLSINLDAPYLRQGNKLIEQTSLTATLGGQAPAAELAFGTVVPTKQGPMPLTLTCSGANDMLDTDIDWKIQRPEAYEGAIGITTHFGRDSVSGAHDIDVMLRQSRMVFNDTVWHVRPATINICGRDIDVRGVHVGYDGRYAGIDGRVSASPGDTLTLTLNDISLDYIFKTLAIDKVQLGGDATGTFYASQLLSGEPHINTPGLSVRGISYNGTVFGDAIVRSGWDAGSRGITLDADITGSDGCGATVSGAIYPLSESLDITFDARHLPVGFMQYYMEAFTGDISGYCSGRARLFGTFKYIDMEGDIKAEGLRMRVDFTNTYYTTSDSVHLRPGLIRIDRATLTDDYGHHATMQGWVRHKFFKEPSFEFNITGADNLLAYNETERDNPLWHGCVFGTGGAFVRGVPGHVDIGVDMRTCPGSTFTFVLSDTEEAGEYSFIRYRDRAALERPDSVDTDPTPPLVRRLRSLVNRHDASLPTTVSLDIEADITPDAVITLVMDPVGGDRIRAVGRGNLRMLYSTTDELKMYGSYTLDRGSYNFTLQDIIIKDFTIREGSTINFRGDPYNADLDIRAAYTLNANLSDLDESFLQDKELNRTNVPVNAMLLVDGPLQSPDIHFDLEFPTLSSDTYRKVRSIVSTDDMMNRQIIYLLALNRFYTPDYMASTTKGNELVSVASSTISSQLSSILGQLSDNWMIAPQFRSDRGDFSDVEVDLALSSTLLNNRLLFNGNFGYRDKSLNNTQFIGDFDIEYLLNRTGSIRLKAYNRYNDRNYYVKSATTTQGVGIMFKRDFDRMFNFLKPHRRKETADTIPATVRTADGTDSIAGTDRPQ